jgi:hypothetical protein
VALVERDPLMPPTQDQKNVRHVIYAGLAFGVGMGMFL